MDGLWEGTRMCSCPFPGTLEIRRGVGGESGPLGIISEPLPLASPVPVQCILWQRGQKLFTTTTTTPLPRAPAADLANPMVECLLPTAEVTAERLSQY